MLEEQSSSRYRVLKLTLLICLLLTTVTLFTHRTTRKIFHKHFSSLLSITPLRQTPPQLAHTAPVPHPPTTRLLKQPVSPGSLGESIRVHRPFLLRAGRPATILRNHTLSCGTFDQRIPDLSQSDCTQYLASQDWSSTGLRYSDIIRNSGSDGTPESAEPQACSPTSVLILLLHSRDLNVCHALMRLLFGFNILQRQAHNPSYLSTPKISHIIIVAPYPATRKLLLATSSRGSENFHRGLVRTLFSNRNPLPVIVTESFTSLHSSSKLGHHIPCFSAGIILHSHANRFAFPDSYLGDHMGYDDTPSLQAPLSSDALALRSHTFYPDSPPVMRNKVLYVHRSGTKGRSWTSDGEQKFRALLRNITQDEQVELFIFEAVKPWPNFQQQILPYAEASVIIGFHGAGLAHGVYAPRNASLVEIEPENHRLNLFGNLQSSGLQYETVYLSKGTAHRRGRYYHSDLSDTDAGVLEKVLRERIRHGKSVVATLQT